MNRRNFMIGSGIVAAGAALASAIKIQGAQAAAPVGTAQAPGFYRTKVGAVQVTALLDGGMTLGDELMSNITPDALTQAKEAAFLPAGKMFPAYVNGYLVNNGTKTTLIDTGAKGFAPTLGNLMTNLRAAGVAPEQIDEIIITHAHPDHTNGLLDETGKSAFANARLRIATPELAFWYDDANAAKYPDKKMMFDLARKNLGPYKDAGRIETFALGADLGAGLWSVSLPGHTPGHSGVRVSDGGNQLIIWGDIVHIPAVQFANPQASIAFDTDIDMARATRAKIFDEAAQDRIRVAGMHLAFPGIGHLVKRGAGYEFVEQMWETNV